MAGKTALQLLGLTALDGKTKPAFADRTLLEISNEHADVANPHPDLRRGGLPNAPVTITENTEADHDGYMGRGSGQKTTHPGFADR